MIGADPFAYFNDVFEHLATGWRKSRATELMPQAWLAAQQKAELFDSDGGLAADHE